MVLCPDVPTTVGPPLWSNGFLPAINQGTYISDKIQAPTDAAPPERDEKKDKEKEKLEVEKSFDPKKLISYINNPKFFLPEQEREMALLQKLEKLRGADSAPQVDAVIVASSLKVGGVWWNPVDEARVRAFMQAAR